MPSRCWLLGLLGLMAAPAHATTYYVAATGGSNANTGTLIGAPLATLQYASGKTVAGDTVLVRGGTYTFNSSTDPLVISRSGSAGNVITYQAYPNETPVISFGGGAWEGINIQANYIVVDGFTVSGPSRAYVGNGWGGSSGPSKATGTGNEACIVAGSSNSSGPYYHHIVIRNNVVAYCSESGIQGLHADYLTIEHNTVHDNSNWSAYEGSGISIYESYNTDGVTTYKNYVQRNTMYNNKNLVAATGGSITDGEGLIIDDNKWTQNSGTAYTGRTLVANNVAYNNGGPGIEVFNSAHTDVVNNSTYRNQTNHAGDEGEIAPSVASDIYLNNNIAVALAGKKVNGGSWNGGVYANNLYYGGSIQTAGSNDLTADPLYVNPAAGDLSLQLGSPGINSGTATLAPATDLNGTARPSGGSYDRGAYEYVALAPPPPTETCTCGCVQSGSSSTGTLAFNMTTACKLHITVP